MDQETEKVDPEQSCENMQNPGETSSEVENLSENYAEDQEKREEEPTSTCPACCEPDQAEEPVFKKSKKGWFRKTASVILVTAVLTGGVTAGAMGVYYHRQMELMTRHVEEKLQSLEQSVQQNRIPAPLPESGPLTPGQVYQKNLKSVVAIFGSMTVEGMEGTSAGSGFLASSDGYIVTNCHVIEGTQDVKVQDYTGKTYPAQILGKDAVSDIALLKIEGDHFTAVEFGTAPTAVGDQVIAMGHPLGVVEQPVLTVGYVSAMDQSMDLEGSNAEVIQIDAALNSGVSGGPVFNSFGQVVGIATGKLSGFSNTGASIEGVSYAIPMEVAVTILPELKENGRVRTAYLGVMVKEVDMHAQEFGVHPGIYVDEPMKGLAADQAGIRKGDVILELGGKTVESLGDLTRALHKHRAGEEITVKLWRNGNEVFVTVLLGEKPEEPAQD